MTVSTIKIKKLTASEGMVLTNGGAYSSVGGEVYLGINDSAENWHEITEEEYNTIFEEQTKDVGEY